MNTRTFTLFVISALWLIACQSRQTGIPVVDIDNPAGSVDLKISDLLDNITIVPLETNDELLLSTEGGTSFEVTNRYILVRTREKLLQFDRQGNYMRTLAYRGNGPNEFNMIMTTLIDEKRELLYYNDSRMSASDASVACIDLNNGRFLEFHNPGLSPTSIREIDAEGNIYGRNTPPTRVEVSASGSLSLISPTEKVPDTLVLAYKYNRTDNSFTHFVSNRSFVADQRSTQLFRQGDHVSFLQLSYSDTLYRLEGSNMIPQYVIQLRNQMTDMQKGGVTASFRASGRGSFIITKSEAKMTLSADRITVNSNTLAYLFLDRAGVIKSIKSFTIDPVALTVDMNDFLKPRDQRSTVIPISSPLPRVSGSWGFYAIEALDMVELIDNALKGNSLSTNQRKALEEVAAKINDDSNPVLIIGKIR